MEKNPESNPPEVIKSNEENAQSTKSTDVNDQAKDKTSTSNPPEEKKENEIDDQLLNTVDVNDKEDAAETAIENKAFAELKDVAPGPKNEKKESSIPGYLFQGDSVSWEESFSPYKKADDKIKKTLIHNLIENGFAKPSHIQSEMVPFLSMERVGALAQSQNGTGKTLAYMVPSILQVDSAKSLDKNKKTFLPQVIILTPNIILVNQIKKDLEILTKNIGENMLVGVKVEYKGKKKCVNYTKGYIFVDTPDHVQSAIEDDAISFDGAKLFVIDEADLVIETFASTLFSLLSTIIKLEKGTNICFISATYTEKSTEFVNKIFKEMKYGENRINETIIPSQELNLEKVVQYKLKCNQKEQSKANFVTKLCLGLNTQIIIFFNSKKFADVIFQVLKRAEVKVAMITGDVKGVERKNALEDFRSGKKKVLLTTNLLARGFDERSIGVVINLDIPQLFGDRRGKPDIETYIHRVGRTGRFGDSGIAVNLYYDNEDSLVSSIEKHYGMVMDELDYDIDEITEKLKKKALEIDSLNDEKRKEGGEKSFKNETGK